MLFSPRPTVSHVDGAVAGDAIQPGAEACFVAVARECFSGDDERVLGDVLGVVMVSEQAKRGVKPAGSAGRLVGRRHRGSPFGVGARGSHQTTSPGCSPQPPPLHVSLTVAEGASRCVSAARSMTNRPGLNGAAFQDVRPQQSADPVRKPASGTFDLPGLGYAHHCTVGARPETWARGLEIKCLRFVITEGHDSPRAGASAHSRKVVCDDRELHPPVAGG